MGVRLASVVVLAACVLPLAGGASQAASLESIQGEVLIDRGGGFDSVGGPTSLDPGNTVIVNPGGSAVVVYSDECKVPVQPGAVLTVAKYPPCGGGGGSFNSTTLLIGGAVIGLGAGAAVLLTSGGDDNPASP
jgi:hypothetical protein